MEQMETNTSKTKIAAMFVALIFLVSLLVGLSLAIFQYAKLGNEENKMTTGTLIMEVDDTGADEINITDAYPMDDEDGMNQTPYIFTVRNTGTAKAQYRIRLVKDEASYTNDLANVDSSYIKYGFQKGNDTPTIGFVDANSGILITDELLAGNGGNQEYSLRLWIDSEKELPNTLFETKTIEFHGKIQVEAIQEGHKNYTTGE